MAGTKKSASARSGVSPTPVPWKIHHPLDILITIRGDGPIVSGVIATVNTAWSHTEQRKEQKANAEFIVRAVNCHQELLDACKDIEKAAKHFAGFHSSAYLNAEKSRSDSWNAMLESVLKIQAAIKKAESGG